MHRASLETGTHPLARATVAAACACLAFAALGTILGGGALWAWLLASLPVVALAGACGPGGALVPWLQGAFLLWAIGDTVAASYDGNQEGALLFYQPPGILALWRILAVTAAAVATARAARRLAAREPPGVAVPLAVGAAAALALACLLEMPLTAWLWPREGADALAVGSLMASQDLSVRAVLHTLAAVLACTSAFLLARLHRPDWFGARRRGPLPATIRVKGPRAAKPVA